MEALLLNTSIHYEVYGEGKPILMIHGFYPDHRLMTGCMEPLFTGKDKPIGEYRRIYLDLPGMGTSQAAEWIQSSDDMLEVVRAFIDHVIPNESFIVVGESYGGYMARGLLSLMPERIEGAAFICPMIIANASDRKRPEHAVLVHDKVLMQSLTAEMAEDFSSMSVVQSPEIHKRYEEEIMCGVRMANGEFLTGLQQKGYAFSQNISLEPVPYLKPTLFLTGRQDASTGYADAWTILDHYPRATFAVLDLAGHNLQIEQVELFNGLFLNFFHRMHQYRHEAGMD